MLHIQVPVATANCSLNTRHSESHWSPSLCIVTSMELQKLHVTDPFLHSTASYLGAGVLESFTLSKMTESDPKKSKVYAILLKAP